MFSIRSNSCVKSGRNRKNPERLTKLKPSLNKYKWEGIDFLSEKDDREKFGKNNTRIGPNVLYAEKLKSIIQELDLMYCMLKNSNQEKQVILLMISNGK